MVLRPALIRGAPYCHREKADRNSKAEAVAVCSLPRPDVGLFFVDDTAKVSKGPRSNIGASKAPLLSSGKQTIPSALLSKRSEIMKTVADQFAETLAAAGVKRIYGIVGDSLNGLTDAIRRQGKIEWVHVRHEEVAAFAAGAEAHLTGELAVCAGRCGPGNLHLINGLFDCQRSRVPVLAVAAQIPSAELGAG
jgi:hypothetical protein